MRCVTVILAICSFAVGGCGTFSYEFCGPVREHHFYGGVWLDVEAAKEGGLMTLMLADIPFSAVIDTLLVPYFAYDELTDPPHRSVQSVIDEHVKTDLLKTYPIQQSNSKE